VCYARFGVNMWQNGFDKKVIKRALWGLCFFAVYSFVIWSKPLVPLAGRVASYSVGLFLLLFFLYVLSFVAESRTEIPLGLLVTLVIGGLTLLDKWGSGFSDNSLIGGLLPYKDGGNYYISAEMLLNGIRISRGGSSAAWRPLFPGFFAIFLLLTRHHLQWALALIYGWAGIGLYLASRRVARDYGILAGSLLATFLFFYLQPSIGSTMSESAGFLFGCLSFVLLWRAAQYQNAREFLAGLVVLTLALSIRAGAFFILPMLVLWAGWTFRGTGKFSMRWAGIAVLVSAAAFVTMNVIYPRLVVERGVIAFGNFAYTLFGQVRGGTGWNSAIKIVGTTDPEPIMQETLRFFRQHPLSFFIGAAKSYRDFFFTEIGLFQFMSDPKEGLIGKLFWIAALLLFGAGIIRAWRFWKVNPVFSFLLACLIGVFFSVPFLPPIDGGSRFYASSMVFSLALPALALPFELPIALPFQSHPLANRDKHISYFAIFSFSAVVVLVIFPILILHFSSPSLFSAPTCSENLRPFVVKLYPGSYLDLVKAGDCGFAPDICMPDFIKNCTELKTDDFYQEIVSIADQKNALRMTLALNLLNGNAFYLIGTPEQLDISAPGQILAGCAVYIRTRTQYIYLIQSSKLYRK